MENEYRILHPFQDVTDIVNYGDRPVSVTEEHSLGTALCPCIHAPLLASNSWVLSARVTRNY